MLIGMGGSFLRAVRQIELALRHAEDHALREAKGGLPSHAG